MAAVGVDEAGKGPVLGSMFAAAIRWPDGVELPEGIADSKQLSAARREALDERLRESPGAAVTIAEVPVARIDDPHTDMNTLTVAAHAEAVGAVARPGDRVRCDAADVDADRFARRVAGSLTAAGGPEVDVTAEHRADERGGVVSAAGIVAKVARDAHVATLAEEYGELGSGYPADPATKSFLTAFVEREGCLPDCARATWETSRRALGAVEQAGLGEY